MIDYTKPLPKLEDLFNEDAPTNSTAGGKVAGIGGPNGEPGVNKKKKASVVIAGMLRRKMKA